MLATVTRLYGHAPVWAQHLACSAEGLRIQLERFPPGFSTRVRQVEARMQWTEAQRQADRRARLRTMLIHAGQHVPYWRDLFARVGFSPHRMQHEDELARLPRLTKDIIVREGSRMWASEVPAVAGRMSQSKTSGTTGAGLVFRASESALREQWAVCWRYRRAHGITRRTWCAQLGGRVIVPLHQQHGPYVRVNAPGRQVLLSGYHLGPHTVQEYLDEIEQRALPWIHGYPSLVVPLARAALAAGRRLPALRWVTTSSENLGPVARKTIEEAFGVVPRDLYAQTEAIANACEWPDGQLRFDEDFSVIELLEHDGDDSSVRRIVGTSLDHWHQPFIRYETGDLVRVEDEPDESRAPGRRLLSIDGRDEDYVELDTGARVGRLDHVFKALTFIHEAQIRQRQAGAIAIHVVPRGAWTPEHEARLRDEVRQRLGPELQVEVVMETRLPRTNRGKLRLVIREA
ncbi:MAG: hypothetical protein AAF799_25260 [Myxococcota bacterium]